MDGLVISSGEFRERLEGEGLRSNRQGNSASQAIGKPRDVNDVGFADTLKSAILDVNKLQQEADFQMQKLATGKTQNVHETMIKAEKADIALRLMIQVRNKLIDAYQEIMKMQV
ncbi:MAG: flagellar hook-basal body complex protein FliE [Bdellovibrionales bacterium]|nr:flagellar hook-basal body complex protein FliE [Bdellovibrionales bacterium]